MSATWFNQPWLERQLQPGTFVRLRGRQGRYGFDVRSFDIGMAESTADFAPVYSVSEELTPKKLRELVGAALPRSASRSAAGGREGSRSRCRRASTRSGRCIVRASLDEAEAGRRRLAFDELLVLQVGLARRRREREAEVAPALAPPGELVARYRDVLPFRLTEHQERAIAEIDGDLAAHRADAAAAAGRGRFRQDGRRALRAATCCRVRPAGGADGADGDARRAALPHPRGAVPRARRLAARC